MDDTKESMRTSRLRDLCAKADVLLECKEDSYTTLVICPIRNSNTFQAWLLVAGKGVSNNRGVFEEFWNTNFYEGRSIDLALDYIEEQLVVFERQQKQMGYVRNLVRNLGFNGPLSEHQLVLFVKELKQILK